MLSGYMKDERVEMEQVNYIRKPISERSLVLQKTKRKKLSRQAREKETSSKRNKGDAKNKKVIENIWS